MIKTAIIALAFGSSAAMAYEKTYLETPINYLPEASVISKVKDECNVESMLDQHLGHNLGRLNKGEGTVIEGSNEINGHILRVKIARVMGVGGGAYSGPKSITVVAELLDGDKLKRQTRLTRWSLGGVFGPFRGTCSILDRAAISIAKDLTHWVKDATYVVKEDADAKDDRDPKEEKNAKETPVVSN